MIRYRLRAADTGDTVGEFDHSARRGQASATSSR